MLFFVSSTCGVVLVPSLDEELHTLSRIKYVTRLTRMGLKISWVDHSQLVGMTMWLSRPEELASLACRKFSPTVENRGCSDQHAKVSLSMGAEGGDFASSLPVNLR